MFLISHPVAAVIRHVTSFSFEKTIFPVRDASRSLVLGEGGMILHVH